MFLKIIILAFIIVLAFTIGGNQAIRSGLRLNQDKETRLDVALYHLFHLFGVD